MKKNMLFLNSKEIRNMGWLIGGRIVQMFLSLIVSILTARYLGPSNYGLISYGTAYVGFFMAISTLGINSIIVKEFIDHPDEHGTAIGTTLLLRIISSFISVFIIFGIVCVLDYNEPITITVVALCSFSLVFHSFDTINYWFQYQYKSKVTSISSLVAYVVTSVYKICLLVYGKSVLWFAFATSIDYIILGILIYFSYRKSGGQELKFSLNKSKYLLSRSYHYILSGMMVSIYGQTDKLMLKQMTNEANVGFYAIATSVCSMWNFVLYSIIDSINPTILRLHNENYYEYEKKNRQLYALIFYIAITVSLAFQLFGKFAIVVLYSESYLPAVKPLKIITWYTAFSFLGVARNSWLVCENKQKFLKYIYLSAIVFNIILNYIFIPIWGTTGAALASLITQISTSIVFPFFISAMKPNSKLMLEAILLKDVF